MRCPRRISPAATVALVATIALTSLVVGCRNDRTQLADGPKRTSSSSVVAASPRPASLPPALPDQVPAVARLVAIGDIHGDHDSALRALRLAGAIDDQGNWSGGALVVVQVGDQIDRADSDRSVIDLFERLVAEAKRAGGAVYPLLGNHEVMVAQGNLTYVTKGAMKAFADLEPATLDADLRRYPPIARGHRAAMRPGGPYARKLAARNLAMRVGDTLFVHGGLLPKHASNWRALNVDTQRWLAGLADIPPHFSSDAEERPLWSRHYSFETDADDCVLLKQTLAAFDAKRLVVAHTVQPTGVSSACDEAVWRVDTGMSRAYHGPIEVLEITPTGTRVLREGSSSPSASRPASGR